MERERPTHCGREGQEGRWKMEVEAPIPWKVLEAHKHLVALDEVD